MLPDYLTTAEVAGYLRLKERTIYELVAKGEIPCSRATGKLLFPRRMVDAWVEAHVELQDARLSRPPPIMAGSSDPLLEWALRESRCGLAVLTEGSSAGLARLEAGEAMAVGLHVGSSDETPDANAVSVSGRAVFDLVLVHWAWREQGLLVEPGNPKRLATIDDAARIRARFVARQPGSGTALLLDRLLGRAGLAHADLNMLPSPALTHGDVGSTIAEGAADCGLGIEAVARRFGLGFVPLHRERFDIACRRRFFLEPPLQQLFAFARGEAFRARATRLGGYDVRETGTVLFNR